MKTDSENEKDRRNREPESKLLGSVPTVLSISAGLSLYRLLNDAYSLQPIEFIARLLEVYEGLLGATVGQIALVANDVFEWMGWNFQIPDHWKHLFVWMVFFLSGIRYTPQKFPYISWVFRFWAVVVAVSFSLLSASTVTDVGSAAGVVLSTGILFVGVYLYYMPLHLVRATFDRPIENQIYQSDVPWRGYFLKQERGFLHIVFAFIASIVVMISLTALLGLDSSIALLLIVFSIMITVLAFILGIRDTRDRRKQSANSEKATYEIFSKAANIRSAKHYAIAILVMAAGVALSY